MNSKSDPPVNERSEIERVLDELNSSCNHAHDRLERLLVRLEPIMIPKPQSPPEPNPNKAVETTVGQSIDRSCESINHLIARINRAIDCLGI